MIVWVLIVAIKLAGPMGITKPMPYLAFTSEADCMEAIELLPEDTKSDCVAFAADRIEPE